MLTTSNPRLWFTLIALLLGFICLGGTCLGIAALVGTQESDYLRAANQASTWRPTPFPEQAFLFQAPEPKAEQWEALSKALPGKAADWESACQKVLAMKTPENLASVRGAIEAAQPQVSDLFDKAKAAIASKDRQTSREALVQIRRRLRALEREMEGILQRIYQPDSLKEEPSGLDPARPPGV